MPRAAKPIGHRVTFDRDQVPTIACFHRGRTRMPVAMRRLAAALQEYVDRYFAPVWGTPCRCAPARDEIEGAWGLAFLADADEANVLGYHDLTRDGLPLAKVFLNTLADPARDASVVASHELAEMLVDPAINLYSTGPRRGFVYAYETVDPVEEDTFEVRGLPMSNFVYPAWFESFRRPGSARFDHLGLLRRPFSLRPGGYQIVLDRGRWKELHGSARKTRSFAKEDRRQHRSEYRKIALRRGSASA
jgi:hypothetical protein